VKISTPVVELQHRRRNAAAQLDGSGCRPASRIGVEYDWTSVESGHQRISCIGCSDTANLVDKPEDVYSVICAQAAGGSWSDVFVPQIWVCAQWPFKAKEQFSGPYASIKTQNPILLANGKYDSITPVSGAWEVSANLEGVDCWCMRVMDMG
jgi:hypothetical protein